MPVGLQMVCTAWEEHRLLYLASVLEHNMHGYTAPQVNNDAGFLQGSGSYKEVVRLVSRFVTRKCVQVSFRCM